MLGGIFARIIWAQKGIFLWVLLMLVLVIMGIYLKRDTIIEYRRNLQQRDEVEQDVRLLEHEVEQHERERQDLIEGGFISEKVAREKLGMSRPGEQILKIESFSGIDMPSTESLQLESALPQNE